MSEYVKQSAEREFIVGTEDNFAHRLKTDNPEKIFHPVHTQCECMNSITLEKVNDALKNMEYEIQVPDAVREKAFMAVEKMITVL